MNFIERIVESVKNAFSDLISEISSRFREWKIRQEINKEKRKYAGYLISSEIQYVPEEPDKLLALQVVSFLNERFPNGIEAKLQEISVEERKDLLCQVVEEAEKIFEIEPVNFEIKHPSDIKEFLELGCGSYNKAKNLLCLNGSFVESESIELVEEQIYTIIHELKHARQYSAIEEEKDYGYSEETIIDWRYNAIVYIRQEVCDEAYRKQALENDAFGFENYVRELFTANN